MTCRGHCLLGWAAVHPCMVFGVTPQIHRLLCRQPNRRSRPSIAAVSAASRGAAGQLSGRPAGFSIYASFLGVADADHAPEIRATRRGGPMKYAEPFSINESRRGGPGYLAMQGDSAITCVDWQAFHSWQDGDPAFTGLITVLDQHGGRQTMANWPSPTDEAADTALGHTGWQRVGPWNSDHNGRRSAPVHRPTDRRTGAQAVGGAVAGNG